MVVKFLEPFVSERELGGCGVGNPRMRCRGLKPRFIKMSTRAYNALQNTLYLRDVGGESQES